MTKLEHAHVRKLVWKPDKWQLVAVKFLLEHAFAGLLLSPGFGKTATSLAAFAFLKEMGLANRMLIIAPARVAHLVWPAELDKWKDYKHLSYHVLHGAKKEEELWATLDKDIIITNFESLAWLMDITTIKHKTGSGKTIEVNKKRFKQLGFDTLVIDELSKLKHTNSGRYKTLKQVVHMFGRRWGLTGSPAANGLMGLFGQSFILDEGRSLGKHITKFRHEYFDKDDYGFGFTPKYGASKKIYERVSGLMLRIDEIETNVKLPKAEPRNIYVELPPVSRRVYDELESDLIAEIDNKVVTAATSATASMKCRQVCSGEIYIDPDVDELLARHKVKAPKKAKRETIILHDEKVEALRVFLDELEGQPVLIALDFRHEVERIGQMKNGSHLKYPDGVPYIGGGVSPKEAKELERSWLAGEITELYVHPQAAAHGLNLQHWGDSFPAHVLWFSLTWDFELYDQLNRRIRRRGNLSSRVFIHHMLARDTVDEKIIGILYKKNRQQNILFQALKELRDDRYKAA